MTLGKLRQLITIRTCLFQFNLNQHYCLISSIRIFWEFQNAQFLQALVFKSISLIPSTGRKIFSFTHLDTQTYRLRHNDKVPSGSHPTLKTGYSLEQKVCHQPFWTSTLRLLALPLISLTCKRVVGLNVPSGSQPTLKDGLSEVQET